MIKNLLTSTWLPKQVSPKYCSWSQNVVWTKIGIRYGGGWQREQNGFIRDGVLTWVAGNPPSTADERQGALSFQMWRSTLPGWGETKLIRTLKQVLTFVRKNETRTDDIINQLGFNSKETVQPKNCTQKTQNKNWLKTHTSTCIPLLPSSLLW